MMNKESQLVLWFFLLAVVFIGGLNWLVTAIRSMNSGIVVPDLLNLVRLPQKYSNYIYIVVFLCSLFMLIWAINYNYDQDDKKH